MKFAFWAFVIWRLLLFIPIVLGNLFLEERGGYTYPGINHFLLYPWANFDGIHYLAIATNSYTTEANFFPLFPVLIKVLNPFLGNFFYTGFLISNISFLTALIILYKLILLDYSKAVARWTIILLLIFPASFYFGAIYSESLFLLLIVSSFYLARRDSWFSASLSAFLCSATRIIGIFMLPALVYQFIKKEGFRLSLRFLSFFLIPIGILSYALFNFYKWGDALYFIKAHGNLANSRSVDTIILFPQTIFRYFKILTDLSFNQYEWWIALLEVLIFFTVSVLLYFAWKRKIQTEYLIFSILAFLLPTLSGTFSGLPRYVIILFPIFIVLAQVKIKFIKILYVVISPILLFVLLMFFSRGYFVA